MLALAWVGCSGGGSPGEFPSRDIKVYINSSQGGATDQWVRFLSAAMEEELGVNLVCINLPGAKGGTGAKRVAGARPDGYTILGCSENTAFLAINGVGPAVDQWHFLVGGGSKGVLAVRADSPWTDGNTFFTAAQKDPGKLRVGNSGAGKLWHLKALLLAGGSEAPVKHIPYNGSAPAITALLSGEVHAVSCALSEIQEYVRGGKARVIADTDAGSGNLRQWLGFAIPKGVPAEVAEKLTAAFTNAMAEPATRAWIAENESEALGMTGEPASGWVAEMQSAAAWAVHDAGLAKSHPEELGLKRPDVPRR